MPRVNPRWLKGLAIAAAAAVVIVLTPSAQARVFVGVHVGVPLFGPAYPAYAYPAYYVPPPVYYAPPVYYPPAVYAPAAVVTAPAPVATPAAQTGTCREFRGNATVDGRNQPFYGTACLEADGRWHIVR